MTTFEAHLRLLLELHTLMAAGKGDTEEADSVRDWMEKPWYGMSEADMRLSDDISEALYGDDSAKKSLAEQLKRTLDYVEKRRDLSKEVPDPENKG